MPNAKWLWALPVRAAFCLVIACGASAVPASAQVYIGRPVPHGGTVEASGGVTYSGGYDLGSVSAEETRNTGTGTGPFVLFTAESRVKPAAALHG